jgi:hypothetical protein
VSWELTEQRRRRGVRNAEGGTSGRLPADQNSYTIDKLRSGTSYDITVTVFNPAGSSSTTFTRSTEGGGEFQRQFTQKHSSTVTAMNDMSQSSRTACAAATSLVEIRS